MRPQYDPSNPDTWLLPSPTEGYWKGGVRGEGTFVFKADSEWAKIFPQGVPYTRGMADFSSATVNLAHEGRILKGVVNIAVTGKSKKDFALAMTRFADENKISVTKAKELIKKAGLTWHHNADGTMILVKRSLNEGLKHTGYAAYARYLARGRTAARFGGLCATLALLWMTDTATAEEGLNAVAPPVFWAQSFGDSTIEGYECRRRAELYDNYANRYDLPIYDRCSFLESLRGKHIVSDELIDAETADLHTEIEQPSRPSLK